jgi:hypothetical protein
VKQLGDLIYALAHGSQMAAQRDRKTAITAKYNNMLNFVPAVGIVGEPQPSAV